MIAKVRKPVRSPKGIVFDIWRRYFSQFFVHLEENCLDRDLYQVFELIALLVQNFSLADAGKVTQREFREFPKSLGFSKQAGRYVVREGLHPDEWWRTFQETGKPPGKLN